MALVLYVIPKYCLEKKRLTFFVFFFCISVYFILCNVRISVLSDGEINE